WFMIQNSSRLLCAILFTCACASAAEPIQQATTQPIEFRDGLVIGRVGSRARVAIAADAVVASLAAGTFALPEAGKTIATPRGDIAWKAIAANKDGAFEDPALAGGYLFSRITAPKAAVMLLEASGHGMVYVNGQPRGGDPYGYGYVHLPVQ